MDKYEGQNHTDKCSIPRQRRIVTQNGKLELLQLNYISLQIIYIYIYIYDSDQDSDRREWLRIVYNE